MSTQEITSTNNLQQLSISSEKDQYTLRQILGIWLEVLQCGLSLGWSTQL
jgi:hypothetical protein